MMNNANTYTTLCYRNLSEAIADINQGNSQNAVTAASDAAVAVHLYPSGKRTVALLKEISESTQISITESIDLVLNGNLLRLTTPEAQLTFGADTFCSIDATLPGSSIRKECDGTSANMLVSDAQELLIRGGSYCLEGAIAGLATGFRANAGKLELRDCTLELNNTSTAAAAVARTLFAAANARVLACDSIVKAEALYLAYAVMTAGTMELRNTAVSGNATSEQGAAFTSVTVTVGGPGKLKLCNCTVTSSGETVCVTGIHNEGDLQLANCGMVTTGVHNHTFGIMNTGTAAITGSAFRTESTDGNVFGIQNDNTLSLEKVTVTVTGENGVVYGINNADELTLSDAELTVVGQNDTINGIWNNGTVTVKDTTIESTNQAGEACGIRNLGALTVENTGITASSVNANVYGIQSVKQADSENNTAHITGLTITAASTNGITYGIYNSAVLQLERSKVFSDSQSNHAYGIDNNGTAQIHFVDVHANTYDANDAHCYAGGIRNLGTMTIAYSKVRGDAPGGHSITTASSTGISNFGTLCSIHTDAAASHTGLHNGRYLFVEGGIFTGYSHGGFYFAHGPEGLAFVNNALMRCGHYSGIHFDSIDTSTDYPLAGAYVGGGDQVEQNCNITVHLDSCVFDSASSLYGLTLRATSGEYGNIVNMSNCSMIKANQKIRIDKYNSTNNAIVSPPHHVNVGIGSGITTENFEYPEFVSFTGESYRQTQAGFKALVEAKAVESQE